MYLSLIGYLFNLNVNFMKQTFLSGLHKVASPTPRMVWGTYYRRNSSVELCWMNERKEPVIWGSAQLGMILLCQGKLSNVRRHFGMFLLGGVYYQHGASDTKQHSSPEKQLYLNVNGAKVGKPCPRGKVFQGKHWHAKALSGSKFAYWF